MKKNFHYLMLTTTIAWLISIPHSNDIFFLWPHTMQQMTPTEKIEVDMLVTFMTAIMFTLMNVNMMSFMKSKKMMKLKEKMMLYMYVKMMSFMLMYLSPTNIQSSSNIITWTSIKNSSWFIMIIVFMTSMMMLYNMIRMRMLYIPLTMTTMMMPSDPLMMTMYLLLMVTLLEMNMIFKKMTMEHVFYTHINKTN